MVDPVTATTAVAAAVLAGTAPAAWRLRRRVRQVETHAERLRQDLRAEYHAANRDPLTGLPNRRGFFRHGEALLADPASHPLVTVVVDLDEFKRLNDRYGHAAGDQVLVVIARRFAAWADQVSRPASRSGRHAAGAAAPAAGSGSPRRVLARLGGDEFAGLLSTHATDHAWLRRAARELNDQLAAPVLVSGHRLRPAASVGAAAVPPATSLADALRHADAAMYRAKAGGYQTRTNGSDPAALTR